MWFQPASFGRQYKSATANVARVFASVKSDLCRHREDIQAQFTSVKAELSANQTKLEQLHERLLQSFESETRELREELDGKRESETRRLSQLITQVQTDTASEMVAVKSQLQNLGSEFDSRLGQSNTSTQ
jgi:Skp family chaperone for outer membrane proteins